MKFIINKDKLSITDENYLVAGSINFYEAEVEYDESWETLNMYAVLVKDEEGRISSPEGFARAVIDNKVYIDSELTGTWYIGFVGYSLDDNVKDLQISTNFAKLIYDNGAGTIEVENEDIPSPSEWELYISQLESITETINGLAEDLTEQVQEVETKLENGDFDGADGQDGITPTIGQNGNWFLGNVDTGKPSRGQDGVNGQDGYSPSASVNQISNGATITITDKNGTTTATVYNGQDGQDGQNRNKSELTVKTVLTELMDLVLLLQLCQHKLELL